MGRMIQKQILRNHHYSTPVLVQVQSQSGGLGPSAHPHPPAGGGGPPAGGGLPTIAEKGPARGWESGIRAAKVQKLVDSH